MPSLREQPPEQRREFRFLHPPLGDGDEGVVDAAIITGHSDAVEFEKSKGRGDCGALVPIEERLRLRDKA